MLEFILSLWYTPVQSFFGENHLVMFNIGFGELVLILLIAFLVVGPKDLPKVGRTLAKGVRELRKFMNDVKNSVDLKDEESYIKEVAQGIAETKSTIQEMNPVSIVKQELASLDPLADITSELNAIKKDVHSLQRGNI